MPGIGAQTRAAVLFGHPVGHSLSSRFQNAGFRAAGLDAVYLTFDVPPPRLPAAVAAITALDLLGANLTIPHKEAVLPLLDEISPLARKVGSVNTVINRRGRLRGETTDGDGFLRSLAEETGLEPRGRRFLLAGTGGAGRALAFSLAEAGAAALILTNRTSERARRLATELADHYPGLELVLVPFADRARPLAAGDVDCLVNASSFGLEEESDPLFEPARFAGAPVVCDLVYHRRTRLLNEARARGLPAVDGLGMLVYQGALAFEHWTGRRAPAAAMFAAVRAVLGGGGAAGREAP